MTANSPGTTGTTVTGAGPPRQQPRVTAVAAIPADRARTTSATRTGRTQERQKRGTATPATITGRTRPRPRRRPTAPARTTVTDPAAVTARTTVAGVPGHRIRAARAAGAATAEHRQHPGATALAAVTTRQVQRTCATRATIAAVTQQQTTPTAVTTGLTGQTRTARAAVTEQPRVTAGAAVGAVTARTEQPTIAAIACCCARAGLGRPRIPVADQHTSIRIIRCAITNKDPNQTRHRITHRHRRRRIDHQNRILPAATGRHGPQQRRRHRRITTTQPRQQAGAKAVHRTRRARLRFSGLHPCLRVVGAHWQQIHLREQGFHDLRGVCARYFGVRRHRSRRGGDRLR